MCFLTHAPFQTQINLIGFSSRYAARHSIWLSVEPLFSENEQQIHDGWRYESTSRALVVTTDSKPLEASAPLKDELSVTSMHTHTNNQGIHTDHP